MLPPTTKKSIEKDVRNVHSIWSSGTFKYGKSF